LATKKKNEDVNSSSGGRGQIREIAVSEFFAKNRHLLGFDNPTKSLLTAVREGVDNSLDACEEARILPTIKVVIEQQTENRFNVAIEDNGPGIPKQHAANIFGKLLYGSKFHRLKQSRGQQGIGISAAVMYGQMTTGKPAEVITKMEKSRAALTLKLQIDTKKNAPKVLSEGEITKGEWAERTSGTRIAITMEGAYKEGRHGVLAYMAQTALSNPHADFTVVDPKKQVHRFPRLVGMLPVEAKEIKPHPHGVELGTFIQLMSDAKGQSIAQFLTHAFSRVNEQIVKEVCTKASVKPGARAPDLDRGHMESLYKAIQDTKIMAPPTNCLSPMGEENILKSLYWLCVQAEHWDEEEGSEASAAEAAAAGVGKDKGALPTAPLQAALKSAELAKGKKGKKGKQSPQSEFRFDLPREEEPAGSEESTDPLAAVRGLATHEAGESSIASEEKGYFVTAVSRPPNVYRGNPFQIEVGLCYATRLKADALISVHRFANRVPLQYQASACAMTKATISAPWKSYGLQQSKGALPTGPVVVMIHMASVWVPYTSEAKEAVAHYDEILKELRLAIMECGRRLDRFLRRKRREADEAKKRSYIEKYLEPIGEALREVLSLTQAEKQKTLENLKIILERTREKKAAE
jgi:DNA topoisomerase-6 subunit B